MSSDAGLETRHVMNASPRDKTIPTPGAGTDLPLGGPVRSVVTRTNRFK
jgi:hypothetical protein